MQLASKPIVRPIVALLVLTWLGACDTGDDDAECVETDDGPAFAVPTACLD